MEYKQCRRHLLGGGAALMSLAFLSLLMLPFNLKPENAPEQNSVVKLTRTDPTGQAVADLSAAIDSADAVALAASSTVKAYRPNLRVREEQLAKLAQIQLSIPQLERAHPVLMHPQLEQEVAQDIWQLKSSGAVPSLHQDAAWAWVIALEQLKAVQAQQDVLLSLNLQHHGVMQDLVIGASGAENSAILEDKLPSLARAKAQNTAQGGAWLASASSSSASSSFSAPSASESEHMLALNSQHLLPSDCEYASDVLEPESELWLSQAYAPTPALDVLFKISNLECTSLITQESQNQVRNEDDSMVKGPMYLLAHKSDQALKGTSRQAAVNQSQFKSQGNTASVSSSIFSPVASLDAALDRSQLKFSENLESSSISLGESSQVMRGSVFETPRYQGALSPVALEASLRELAINLDLVQAVCDLEQEQSVVFYLAADQQPLNTAPAPYGSLDWNPLPAPAPAPVPVPVPHHNPAYAQNQTPSVYMPYDIADMLYEGLHGNKNVVRSQIETNVNSWLRGTLNEKFKHKSSWSEDIDASALDVGEAQLVIHGAFPVYEASAVLSAQAYSKNSQLRQDENQSPQGQSKYLEPDWMSFKTWQSVTSVLTAHSALEQAPSANSLLLAGIDSSLSSTLVPQPI